MSDFSTSSQIEKGINWYPGCGGTINAYKCNGETNVVCS